jgi:predicted transcriptional regulator
MHAYVRDVMTTSVVAVRPDAPYREMTAMFRTHRVSGAATWSASSPGPTC